MSFTPCLFLIQSLLMVLWPRQAMLNYLILNGAVIVPSFGQAKDKEALSIIKSCFPDRKVIGFNCLEIIREGGGFALYEPKSTIGSLMYPMYRLQLK